MECNECISCDRSCGSTICDFESEKPARGGIPLAMASVGESGTIVRVAGDKKMKSHLTSLGFTIGSSISILRRNGGDLIVDIRGSRIAMCPTVASKLYFQPGVVE